MFGRKKSNKSVAVLGCGPAGLFAAHGLVEAGWDVTIFSKKRKSHMYGAQYLHGRIPGLSSAMPVQISYRLEGEIHEYAEKVYGAEPVKVSPQYLRGQHSGWDIREAYDNAWRLYGDRVVELDLLADHEMAGIALQYRTIVSAVPATILCYNEDHRFVSRRVWAIGDAPDKGIFAPYQAPANTVLCNGTRDVGWYRASTIFGLSTVEWPENRKPPLPLAVAVTKPLYTDCDCYQKTRGLRFVRVGRYGTWSKGVLSHQAYTTGASL